MEEYNTIERQGEQSEEIYNEIIIELNSIKQYIKRYIRYEKIRKNINYIGKIKKIIYLKMKIDKIRNSKRLDNLPF